MKTHLDHHLSDIARIGYFMLIPAIIIYGLIMSGNPDHRVRVCEGREGIQIATYVPGGKRRFSKYVKIKNGTLIPYGEWVRSCRAVHLPGDDN